MLAFNTVGCVAVAVAVDVAVDVAVQLRYERLPRPTNATAS